MYLIFAFAACANIGGVSPVVPKSTPPTFNPSNNWGPAGNSLQVTLTPSWSNLFSNSPLAFNSIKVPYFW